jgi:type I restriction enzyme S subunit
MKVMTHLGEALTEIKSGIGKDWAQYPVLGATREGLAPAKERPGKNPERYKPVFAGTIFYNPMRILIGSIAFVDENDPPGITSPDYVVLQGKKGRVDTRWFYHWLRSPAGQKCISSLARGAVRERMLFNRLAEARVELPDYDTQLRFSKALAEVRTLQVSVQKQLREVELLPQRIVAQSLDVCRAKG